MRARSEDLAPPPHRFPIAAWFILAAALLAHAVLLPSAGYERDLYWFDTWMRTALEHGVAQVSAKVWCDYPPGYLYLLEAKGLLWTFLTGGPLPGDSATSAAQRSLLKLLPVLAGLAGALVLYGFARARRSERTALLVLAAYALNPAMVFNSAVWGQAESIVGLLMLLAALAVARHHVALGFAILTALVLTKAQAIVVAPLLLLASIALEGRRGIYAACRGGFIAWLVLMLPFYAAGRADTVIETILGASGRYPYISMHAYNVWWLFGGVGSRWISDAHRIGNGILSYHALGFIMLACATGLVAWRFWRAARRAESSARASGSDIDLLPALLEACALEVLAFYLFPTEMHERYIVPLLTLLAALCIWRPWIWVPYGVASLAVLVSLAGTLERMYAGNSGVLAVLVPESSIDTLIAAGVFVVLFAVLLLATPDRRFVRSALASGAAAAALIALVIEMPLRGDALLSRSQPIEQSQGWGDLGFDRTVDGNRLSAGGFVFRHGLGTHAPSRLVYDLNGAFRSFETAYRLDDEALPGARASFRIWVDDELRFDSGEAGAAPAPSHVTVPVVGAQRLTLEVLEGGDGKNGDHADWLEPVLRR